MFYISFLWDFMQSKKLSQYWEKDSLLLSTFLAVEYSCLGDWFDLSNYIIFQLWNTAVWETGLIYLSI